MNAQQLMNDLCKFSIGEICAMKVALQIDRRRKSVREEHLRFQPVQIIERQARECAGGVQVTYLVRPHFTEFLRASGFGIDLVPVNEIELAPLPEETPEQVVDGE